GRDGTISQAIETDPARHRRWPDTQGGSLGARQRDRDRRRHLRNRLRQWRGAADGEGGAGSRPHPRCLHHPPAFRPQCRLRQPVLLAWATDLHTRVGTYGPPPLAEMTRLFLEMDAYDIHIRESDEGRPPLAPLIVPHEITHGGPVMHDANVRVTAALVQHPPVVP